MSTPDTPTCWCGLRAAREVVATTETGEQGHDLCLLHATEAERVLVMFGVPHVVRPL